MGIRLAALVLAGLTLAGCISEARKFGTADVYPIEHKPKILITMPANAPSISQQYRQSFGRRDLGWEDHNGIDIHAEIGTKVLAPVDGIVTRSVFGVDFGNQIEMRHVGPDGTEYLSKFWHMSERSVEKGDVLKRGDIMGGLGRTGFLAGGFAHLHFEIRRIRASDNYRMPVDPNELWADGPGNVVCFEKGLKVPDDKFVLTYPVVCK